MSAYTAELPRSVAPELHSGNFGAKIIMAAGAVAVAASMTYLEGFAPRSAWPKTETTYVGRGSTLAFGGLGQQNADFVREAYQPIIGDMASVHYSSAGINELAIGQLVSNFASANLDLDDPNVRLNAVVHSMGLPTLVTGLLAGAEHGLPEPKLGTVLCLGSPLYVRHAYNATGATRIARSRYPGGVFTKAAGEFINVADARSRARRWRSRGRDVATPPLLPALREAAYNSFHGTPAKLWTSQASLLVRSEKNIARGVRTGRLSRIIDAGTTFVDFSDPNWDEVVKNMEARSSISEVFKPLGATCICVETPDVEHADAFKMKPFVELFVSERSKLQTSR